MAAQPNIGGALCDSSVIPLLAPRRKVWLTQAAVVPCNNAAIIGERKTWTYKVNVAPAEIPSRRNSPPKMYIQCTSPGNGQTSCKVWLASGERYRCSKSKDAKPVEICWLQTPETISAVSGPKFAILWICEDMWGRYCCLRTFFPIVDAALVAKTQSD